MSFFWTHRPFRALPAPFLDMLTPSRSNRPFLDARTSSCPVFGRADHFLPRFGTRRPLPARFWTRRPLLARNRPSLDPSLLNLDAPTLSCLEPSFFGHADPFLPGTIPFRTRRPLPEIGRAHV